VRCNVSVHDSPRAAIRPCFAALDKYLLPKAACSSLDIHFAGTVVAAVIKETGHNATPSKEGALELGSVRGLFMRPARVRIG
jgi:hypothetical protein